MRQVMMGLMLVGVVDRIEGDWAAVEWWPTAEIRDVATSRLPPHAQEGDQLIMTVRPRPQGTAIVTNCQQGSVLHTLRGQVHLPSDAPLPTDQRYRVWLRKRPATTHTRSQGRAHPRSGTREHGSMDLRSFRVGASALRTPLSPSFGRSGPCGPAADRPGALRPLQPHDPEPLPDLEAPQSLGPRTGSSHSGQ